MKKQVKKLTMVSITYRGTRFTCFTYAPVINGKTVVGRDVIDTLLARAGCAHRGLSYQVGA